MLFMGSVEDRHQAQLMADLLVCAAAHEVVHAPEELES